MSARIHPFTADFLMLNEMSSTPLLENLYRIAGRFLVVRRGDGRGALTSCSRQRIDEINTLIVSGKHSANELAHLKVVRQRMY